MSRTSCITHSNDNQLVIIRDDYMGICDQDHCAAALLNDLEYWTNIKLGSQKQAEIENSIAQAGGLTPVQDVELWIYKSHEEFQSELLNLFGLNKIGSGLAILKGKGFISTRNNPRFGWDRTVQYFFHIEAVQTAIENLELNPTSLKIKASKASKVKNGSFEKGEAIPQDTSKDTTENPTRKREKGTKKDTIPAAQMNAMKDAIVSAFGWAANNMTKGEWGIVQSTAKELCTVGFETDRVASLYAWCKAKFTTFTPKAMATHLSEYRATRLDKPVNSSGETYGERAVKQGMAMFFTGNERGE